MKIMKTAILIFWIYFLPLNLGISSINKTAEKELRIDLSSIGISDRIGVMPPNFTNIETDIVIIDNIKKEGHYLFREHIWIEKDEYKNYRVINNAYDLMYNNQSILQIADFESVQVKAKNKTYKTYHLCNYCDDSNSTSYKELAEYYGLNDENYKEGEKYKRNFKGLRIIRPTKLYPDYSNGGPILKVIGNKSELKQLLRDPILEGVEYEMIDI